MTTLQEILRLFAPSPLPPDAATQETARSVFDVMSEQEAAVKMAGDEYVEAVVFEQKLALGNKLMQTIDALVKTWR